MRRAFGFGVLVLLAVLLVAPAIAEDEGMQIYAKKCAMCHGKDGVAKKLGKGSRDLTDPEFQQSVSLEEIVRIVADGKGKMPKNKGKLTDEQIQAVSTYVKENFNQPG